MPSSIPAAAGISIPYADDLLAEENTSLYRLIQARRLARCRRCLEDPTQAHRTISEIAYAWAFSDMTHFDAALRKPLGCRRESTGAVLGSDDFQMRFRWASALPAAASLFVTRADPGVNYHSHGKRPR